MSRFVFLTVVLTLITGCSSDRSAAVGPSQGDGAPLDRLSDAEKVRLADVSVLYIGNSHTSMHNLPNLVDRMIRFCHPEKTVYSRQVGVRFLEDVALDARFKQEIETRPWKYVVLQAQKESRSGQYQYSQAEGIEFAKLARARGAAVIFYAEWGLQGVADHGPRIEQIYREMAAASGARVASVGRAWELALAARPDLPLYSPDGNHQTAVGAFLTPCVLFGRVANESPAVLAPFAYPAVGEADRKFLSDTAAKALGQATDSADHDRARTW